MFMATPWLHPGSKNYYYRRRVPKELVELVGYQLEKFSLKTRDQIEAKRRFHAADQKIQARWKNLREGYRRLNWQEIAAVGGDMYHLYMDRFRKFGFSMHHHAVVIENCSYIVEGLWTQDEKKFFDETVGADIDTYLADRGMLIDASTRRSIDYHVAQAVKQACAQPYRWLNGDHRDDPNKDRFPKNVAPTVPVRALESFLAYAGAAELSPATRKRWMPVFAQLADFVGHDDLARIDGDKIVEWLDHLLAGDRKAITVRDVYLAATKAIYGWLVSRRKLTLNPTIGLSVKVPFAEKQEMREFTDREACVVLSAALSALADDLPVHLKAARRWIPWICAYTGARVNEATQLRRSDIRLENGIWVALITPEAGTVKNRKPRTIPLHPHLISQGLIQFVLTGTGDTMFYVPDPRGDRERNAARFRRTGEHLARWVRDLGIVAPDIGPSHGWRHRFKTEGRRVGMIEAVQEAIQGHAPRSEGENYGSFPPDVMLPEILKLVPYRIDGTTVTVAGAATFEYDYGSPEAASSIAELLATRQAAA